MPAVGPDLAPDSTGYLELSPSRPPLYGVWAHGSFAVVGTWERVKLVQIAAFAACGAWLVFELTIASSTGILAALALITTHVVLIRFGLLNIVGSLVSEGLFYSMILLCVAMLLAWLRSQHAGFLTGLLIVSVMMAELRSAAMLVPAATLSSAVGAAMFCPQPSHRRRAILAIGILVAALAVLPLLLGKSAFQVGASERRLGFVILPRISLLPTPDWVAERDPEWAVMASTWRRAAATLNAIALSQFDGQLQEAIRYDLGPRTLLPALLRRSRSEVEDGWLEGRFDADVKEVAVRWIAAQWPTYLRLSAIHFWGLMTAGNWMNNTSREEVWRALQSVSPRTWNEGGFRTDYPLNHVNERLKPLTSVLYFLLRYMSIGVIAVAVVSAVGLARNRARSDSSGRGSVVVVVTVAWAVIHSIPAALFVFPEFRYTYANMLAVFGGGAAWFAHLGAQKKGQAGG